MKCVYCSFNVLHLWEKKTLFSLFKSTYLFQVLLSQFLAMSCRELKCSGERKCPEKLFTVIFFFPSIIPFPPSNRLNQFNVLCFFTCIHFISVFILYLIQLFHIDFCYHCVFVFFFKSVALISLNNLFKN